ncbi:conserved membrane hypothetical protein [Cupriavidus necator]|uniref:Uncharacterized protein n=1 Tax=Cupriavidus necator TaxID=106590 RepID=A0A1K0IPK5_CUPNE|nr:conserved membrane hypothetical protein [Cupriavidus necator]
MAGDNALELYKQHQTINEKHTYFLLAAAGAAIGFAVQKTEGLLLSWWLTPVALAILLWGISFYCGCKHVTAWQSVMRVNADLLKLQSGTHPIQPRSSVEMKVALEAVTSALDRGVDRAARYQRLQFYLLVFGAVFFIIWRALVMVRATFYA